MDMSAHTRRIWLVSCARSAHATDKPRVLLEILVCHSCLVACLLLPTMLTAIVATTRPRATPTPSAAPTPSSGRRFKR